MIRGQKKNSVQRPTRRSVSSGRKANQLSLDFSANVPIEIHIPKFDISNLKKELIWERKPSIELARN